MPFEGWRVAQLVVDRADGRAPYRASGYLVAAGKILTAAHVLAGATAVRVRLDVGRSTEIAVDSSDWWADPAGHLGTDLGVVEIEAVGRPVEPAGFGRFSESAAVLAVQAAGFPLFKLRGTDAAYRDLEHARGHSPLIANRRQGTLAINLDDPPPAADDPSPWQGMSGAAVWSGGRIVGVIAEHHAAEGPGRLTARRLDQAYDVLPPAELHEITTRLGLPSYAEALPDVVPLDPARLTALAYLAQVKDIAPYELIGRESELAEWTAFCAGPDPYSWWQAGPWAGKSALAAWFVSHPPAGLEVVSFFITGRLIEQSDSGAFLTAMIEQLDALDPDDEQQPRAAGARTGLWLTMLESAAARAVSRGNRLVVVVDGLDEDDVGAVPGRGRPSIASLLPRNPPAGVRFLVTSRPDPGLPDDVPADHPLKTGPIRQLATSAIAADVAVDAQRELRDLLSNRTLIDIVGFVAASGGGLTESDLESLTGFPPYVLDSFVRGVFGRSLHRRATTRSRLVRSDDRVLLFGHETLRQTAEAELGDALGRYRDQLHTWLDGWSAAGWPDTTPGYAIRAYVRMLAATADVPRLTKLARDPRRHDFLLRATGNDSAALAEIRRAATLEAERSHPDLQVLTELAVHRHAISIRNQFIPTELPLLWSRLGRPDHAEALTQTMTDRKTRQTVVAELAAAARTAGELDRAERLARTLDESDNRDWFLSVVATDLIRDGRPDQAESISEILADPVHRAAVRTELAFVAFDAALDVADLDRAELLIDVIDPGRPASSTDLNYRVRGVSGWSVPQVGSTRAGLLVELKVEATRAGDDQRAQRLAAAAEAAARAIRPEDPVRELGGLLELAAILGDFGWAEELADTIGRLEARLQLIASAVRLGELERADGYIGLLRPPGSRRWLPAELVDIFAAAGELDRAEELTEQTDPGRRPYLFDGLVEAAVEAGDLARAQRFVSPLSSPFVVKVLVIALAAAATNDDELERAVQLARTMSDAQQQTFALTTAAEEAVAAGDHDKAEHLVQQIPDLQRRATAGATIATAVARAGDPERAEAIARATAQGRFRAEAWTDVAWVLVELDELDRARTLATDVGQLPTSSSRATQSLALAVLVRVALATASYDEADALIQQITHPRIRAQAVTELAVHLEWNGDPDRAENLVITLTDRDDQTRAYTELATASATTGLHQQAIRHAIEAAMAKTADIPDDQRARRLWDQTFTDITLAVQAADNQAADGQSQSEQFAHAVPDPNLRSKLLCALATAILNRTDRARADRDRSDGGRDGDARAERDRAERLAGEAESVARGISDPVRLALALTALAEATALAGDAVQAERLVRLIDDAAERDAALAALSGRLARVGSLDAAQNLARSLRGPVALREVALAAGLKGEHEIAATLITEALSIARATPDARPVTSLQDRITDALSRDTSDAASSTTMHDLWAPPERTDWSEHLDSLLTARSMLHSQAAEFAEARADADSIADQRQRTKALSSLSSSLSAAGRLEEAADLIALLDHRESRALAIRTLIEATSRAGDLAKATAIIDQLVDNHYDRARALSMLATEAAATGAATSVREFIASAMADLAHVPEPSARARVLQELSVACATINDLEQMADLLHTITPPDLQSRALAAVSVALARIGQLSQASASLDDAEKIAQSIERPDVQGTALASLATAAAEMGDTDRARRLLATAMSLDTSRIDQWLATTAKLFPAVIHACGPAFASVYSGTPTLA